MAAPEAHQMAAPRAAFPPGASVPGPREHRQAEPNASPGLAPVQAPVQASLKVDLPPLLNLTLT